MNNKYDLKYNLFENEIEELIIHFEDIKNKKDENDNLKKEYVELSEELQKMKENRNLSKPLILSALNDVDEKHTNVKCLFYLKNIPFIINENNLFTYNDINIIQEVKGYIGDDMEAFKDRFMSFIKNEYYHYSQSTYYENVKEYDRAINSQIRYGDIDGIFYNLDNITFKMMEWDDKSLLNIGDSFRKEIANIFNNAYSKIEKLTGTKINKIVPNIWFSENKQEYAKDLNFEPNIKLTNEEYQDYIDEMGEKDYIDNEIYNRLKNDNNEIYKFVEIIARLGITNLVDIENIYQNDKFKNARNLHTFDWWNKRGFRIKAGEHGIKLYKENDFRKVYFDISQISNITDEQRQELEDTVIYKGYEQNVDLARKFIENLDETISELSMPKMFTDQEKRMEKRLLVYIMFIKFNLLPENNGNAIENLIEKYAIEPTKIDIILADTIRLATELINKEHKNLQLSVNNDGTEKNKTTAEKGTLDKSKIFNYTMKNEKNQAQTDRTEQEIATNKSNDNAQVKKVIGRVENEDNSTNQERDKNYGIQGTTNENGRVGKRNAREERLDMGHSREVWNTGESRSIHTGSERVLYASDGIDDDSESNRGYRSLDISSEGNNSRGINGELRDRHLGEKNGLQRETRVDRGRSNEHLFEDKNIQPNAGETPYNNQGNNSGQEQRSAESSKRKETIERMAKLRTIHREQFSSEENREAREIRDGVEEHKSSRQEIRPSATRVESENRRRDVSRDVGGSWLNNEEEIKDNQIEQNKVGVNEAPTFFDIQKNDGIKNFSNNFGIDKKLLEELLNSDINENNLNEFNRFEDLCKTCDINKVIYYYHKQENLILTKKEAYQRLKSELKDFILNTENNNKVITVADIYDNYMQSEGNDENNQSEPKNEDINNNTNVFDYDKIKETFITDYGIANFIYRVDINKNDNIKVRIYDKAPYSLRTVGINADTEIEITIKAINHIDKYFDEETKDNFIKQLPDIIANPMCILSGSQKDSYVLMTEIKYEGDNIIVPLKCVKNENSFDVLEVPTIYKRLNSEFYFNKELLRHNILAYNKEKMESFITSYHRLYLPKEDECSIYDNSIVNSLENVKFSDRSKFISWETTFEPLKPNCILTEKEYNIYKKQILEDSNSDNVDEEKIKSYIEEKINNKILELQNQYKFEGNYKEVEKNKTEDIAISTSMTTDAVEVDTQTNNQEPQQPTASREELLNRDYINTQDIEDTEFNKSKKFNDNIEAIKTLKKIESENRFATKEEQDVLAKYVGWGGLANYCFDEQVSKKENYDLVMNLLTADEYRSARASVLSAYYTPNYVIKEIYKKIEEFGFKGGKVLEPSCGIGKFFGNMPEEIRKNSEIVGIEKDSISARISKLLYPSITIKNEGYEDEKIKNGTYNLIIGNIPFGDFKVSDKEYNKNNLLIHDYFINKSLDKLADGGICVMLTSTGTLDKKDKKARTLFSEKANLIGAVRLPSGTFGDTSAQTDILFFQKNSANKLGLNQSFINTDKIYNGSKDKEYVNYVFENQITKEIYHIERTVEYLQNIMSEEMYNDLFAGKEQIIKCKDNYYEGIITKRYNRFGKRYERYDMYMCDKGKVQELKDKYDIWVKNGKKASEKPIYDTERDFYILDSDIRLDIDNIIDLKTIKMMNVKVGIENPNYYEKEITTDKKGKEKISIKTNEGEERYIYDENTTLKIRYKDENENFYFSEYDKININSYYKNNTENIVGTLTMATGEYGRPLVLAKEDDVSKIRESLEEKLKNIECVYKDNIEVESIKEDEEESKEDKRIYIDDNTYQSSELKNKKKYSYYLYNNRICFKENDSAYYISDKSFKNNEKQQLIYLINLKDYIHEILNNELNNNIEEANEVRKKLLDTYNEFYEKYGLRINDKKISVLLDSDDDKGLLLSLEVGENGEEREFIRKKTTIKKEISELNVIDSGILPSGLEYYTYEDDNGDIKYVDSEKHEYEEKKTTKFRINEENGHGGLANIFFEPVIQNKPHIQQVNNAQDGLILSLQTQGEVDINFIKEKTKLEEDQIIKDLYGQIYYSLQDNKYITRDEFLSGNIREKIDLYQNHIKTYTDRIEYMEKEISNAEKEVPVNEERIYDLNKGIAESRVEIDKYKPYVNDLNSVLPTKIPYENIDINIGVSWLPLKYYKKFVKDVFKVRNERYYNLELNDKISPFKFTIHNSRYKLSDDVELQFGTREVTSLELLEKAFNMESKTIYKDERDEFGKKKPVVDTEATALANEKIEQIKQAFKNWKENSLDNEEKQEIEELYNRKFNSVIARKFNGDILDFPGMNANITLKAHQKNGIARMIYGRNTGLAHCVGAGKTFEMCAAVMKFKQLGLANKSMIVVPKPVIEQWQREFLTLYPNANILVPNKNDFSKENRLKFMSKIATGNYDAIIVSQEQFQKIPLSTERQIAYMEEEREKYYEYLSEVRNDRSDNRYTIKALQKAIESIDNKLAYLQNEDNNDNMVSFEELGIDKLFVDEAHYYKNAFFTTKLTNVAGIQSRLTLKTYNLQQKVRYMNEKTDYRGVYFATGTPITNSVVEVYTMMKFLQDDILKSSGLNNLDDFVANFCETQTEFELDTTGVNMHLKTRIDSFINCPELIRMFKESWDVINVEDLTGIKLPKANRHVVELLSTPQQKMLQQSFIERCKAMDNGGVDPRKDNKLKLTSHGKASAIDPRLYDSQLEDEEGTKVNAVVKNVTKIYYETMEQKGTQIIFSDMGVPGAGKEFDIYNDIKKKLIKNGIAEKEIAFINDYEDTPEKKIQMQKMMNEGKIRILITSTQKGGTGLNVQHRAKAAHHLSLPWKPGDMTQRDGRVIRQGNMYDDVDIYTYISKGTFDARTFEILASKQNWINQIMLGNEEIRRYDHIGTEEDEVTYDDMVAMSLENSNIKKIKMLEREIKLLELEEKQFHTRIRNIENKIKELPTEIESCKNIKAEVEQDVSAVKKLKWDNYEIKIFGKIGEKPTVYKDRTVGTKALFARMFDDQTLQFNYSNPIKVAEYKGFEIKVVYSYTEKHFCFRAKSINSGHLYYYVDLAASDVGNMTRIDNFIKSFNDELIENHNNRISSLEKELEESKKAVKSEFGKEELIKSKKEELKALHKKDELRKQEMENKTQKAVKEVDLSEKGITLQ